MPNMEYMAETQPIPCDGEKHGIWVNAGLLVVMDEWPASQGLRHDVFLHKNHECLSAV